MAKIKRELQREGADVKILHVVVKHKWYEMQACGEKTEEYREITPYWYSRLYRRKKETGYSGPVSKEGLEYCCHPNQRHILRAGGFIDHELKPYTHIGIHDGYTKKMTIFKITGITVGKGRPDWGAPTDRDVFIIMHYRKGGLFI